MKTISLPFVSIFLASFPLYGFIEKAFDEKKMIEVSFSTRSHNRISIEGGHVAKVHGDGSIFSIHIDDVTGQAFVSLKKDILDKPTTLTIVSGTGMVQDLLVTSNDGNSEYLVLKESDNDSEESLIAQPEYYHKPAVDLLNTILEGKVPFGYGQRPLEATDEMPLPSPLKTKAIKAFEGPFEVIVVYEIQNGGKKQVLITPESLKKDRHLWVFLNAHQLETKQQALCIVSYRKDEVIE